MYFFWEFRPPSLSPHRGHVTFPKTRSLRYIIRSPNHPVCVVAPQSFWCPPRESVRPPPGCRLRLGFSKKCLLGVFALSVPSLFTSVPRSSFTARSSKWCLHSTPAAWLFYQIFTHGISLTLTEPFCNEFFTTINTFPPPPLPFHPHIPLPRCTPVHYG